MGKRKKKTVHLKAKPTDSVVVSVEKPALEIERDNEELSAYGILPSRDLKKNLGCG